MKIVGLNFLNNNKTDGQTIFVFTYWDTGNGHRGGEVTIGGYPDHYNAASEAGAEQRILRLQSTSCNNCLMKFALLNRLFLIFRKFFCYSGHHKMTLFTHLTKVIT